jgi:hypothetical protein
MRDQRSEGVAAHFHRTDGLVSAVVAFKDANFRAIRFDRAELNGHWRRSWRSGPVILIFDDEGPPFHCPAQIQHLEGVFESGKRAELGQQARGCEKPVQNRARAKSRKGTRNQPMFAPKMRIYGTLRQASVWNITPQGRATP